MLLKETTQNLGLQVEPQNILTDFEVALQQSVIICFPQAEKDGTSIMLKPFGEKCRLLGSNKFTGKALYQMDSVELIQI